MKAVKNNSHKLANEGKAAAAKNHQDVDSQSVKEIQKNDPSAVVKDNKQKPATQPQKPDKEDQVISWAAGNYSLDSKVKKGK